HALVNMVVESGKQSYDLVGTGIGALGTALDLWDYQHETVSGIGRLASRGLGTGDIFIEMGRGIIETPGRMLAAAERGDYVGFGAEAMNTYMLGRAGYGLAKGSLSIVG